MTDSSHHVVATYPVGMRIVRLTYAMLNGEPQTTRGELLELAVVLLIVTELVRCIIRH